MVDEHIVFGLGEAVRQVGGGPVMTVDAYVGHLVMCVWMNETGRVTRQTFSPNELALYRPAELAWFRALVRLAPRCRVVAASN